MNLTHHKLFKNICIPCNFAGYISAVYNEFPRRTTTHFCVLRKGTTLHHPSTNSPIGFFGIKVSPVRGGYPRSCRAQILKKSPPTWRGFYSRFLPSKSIDNTIDSNKPLHVYLTVAVIENVSNGFTSVSQGRW